MTTFSVGDRVRHRLYPEAGEGIISAINGVGYEAWWEGFPKREQPYRAVDRVDNLIPVNTEYSPDQAGDTDDDI